MAASEKAEGERVPAAFFHRENAVVRKEIHFAMESRSHRGTFPSIILTYRVRARFSWLGNIVFPRYESEFVDVWTTCNVIKSRANDGVT